VKIEILVSWKVKIANVGIGPSSSQQHYVVQKLNLPLDILLPQELDGELNSELSCGNTPWPLPRPRAVNRDAANQEQDNVDKPGSHIHQ
jgi:hypothetical protein